MPYTQYSLNSFIAQLGVLLDDTNSLYWTNPEKILAVQEGCYVWGAYTKFWRQRGTFNLTVNQSFYSLATVLPTLRTRTWTLQQMVQDIQFALLEAANGVSGLGMSQQISVQSILQSIQRARNQVVIDARFPYSYNAVFAAPSASGQVQFPQTSVYVHRASWQDAISGKWTNLWREDSWVVDHNDPSWTLTPGSPTVYSEAENAPLVMQLAPAPAAAGTLDAITVDSFLIDITNQFATFQLPDEWIHAVKYAALQDIFSSESQNKDALRAQYCQMRYQQAMDFAAKASSVIRLLVNGVPLPVDSIMALDAANPYWRNQPGAPQMAGVLFDFLAVSPGAPDRTYGIMADVVRSAPIPVFGTDSIPLGAEDIPHLIDYCTHILTIKCGGQELKDSFAQYDSFLEAVAGRSGINRAKMRYLGPVLNQDNVEQEQRPDRMEEAKQNA